VEVYCIGIEKYLIKMLLILYVIDNSCSFNLKSFIKFIKSIQNISIALLYSERTEIEVC
jgi:hypothetical protein